MVLARFVHPFRPSVSFITHSCPCHFVFQESNGNCEAVSFASPSPAFHCFPWLPREEWGRFRLSRSISINCFVYFFLLFWRASHKCACLVKQDFESVGRRLKGTTDQGQPNSPRVMSRWVRREQVALIRDLRCRLPLQQHLWRHYSLLC